MGDTLESAFIFDDEEVVKEGEEKEIVLGGFNDGIVFEEEGEVAVEEKKEEEVVEEKKEEVIETTVTNNDIEQLKQLNVDHISRIDSLNKQVDSLQRKSEKEEDLSEIELPTDEDWEADPKAAAEKLMEVRETELKSKLDKESDDKFLRGKEQEVFNTTHKQAWEQSAQLAPDLSVEGSEIRQAVGSVYEKAGLKHHPMGPLLATCAAMVATAYKNQKNIDTKARDEGVQIERSRQERINKGTMVGTGNDGDNNELVLDSNHIAAAKELGIPIEIYKKSLQVVR